MLSIRLKSVRRKLWLITAISSTIIAGCGKMDPAPGGNQQRSVGDLIKQLKDKDAATRKAAVIALAEIGPQAKEAMPDLTRLVQDGDYETLNAAYDALAKVDPDGVGAQIKKSRENLQRLGLAVHIYADSHGRLPPAAIYSKDGKPLLSWRVALLNDLEEEKLYGQFKLDEPWDSAHNKTLLAKMPKVYAPVGAQTKEQHLTFYQIFTGRGAVFADLKEKVFAKDGISFDQITDGLWNTLMMAEAGEPVPWTKPADLAYDPEKPLPRLGGLFKEGFNGIFCDGSVRFIPRDEDAKVIHAWITRSGGEAIGKFPAPLRPPDEPQPTTSAPGKPPN